MKIELICTHPNPLLHTHTLTFADARTHALTPHTRTDSVRKNKRDKYSHIDTHIQCLRTRKRTHNITQEKNLTFTSE